jgi:CheY-like chemotaxis protein
VSKRKLLLADDSITIQKVVNLTFADEGIDVITVGDGDSAMEKISQMSPDVVLADVHMPGLNGYQICEIVRENPATRNLPVVLLVGSFEPFDENEAARVGANAYLTKPFQSIRQLVSQVSDLMEISVTAAREVAADDGPPQPQESEVAEVAGVDNKISEYSEPPASDAVVAGGLADAAATVADTNDIDSLYDRSFTEPEGDYGDGASQTQQHFVDAGMDDEMIEASHAGEVSQTTEPETGFDHYQKQAEIEPAADLSSTEEAPAVSIEPRSDEAVDSAAAEPDRTSPFDTIATSESRSVSEAENESYFDEYAETEQSLSIDLPPQVDFASEESDVLELPPIENGKTIEFTTTQRMMAEGGGREVVSLSPELMDIIVQKVVEKLSEKY